MPDVPSTPAAPPVPPEVTTLTESAWSVSADLDDLAHRLPGDVARNARVADQLSEELSEVAAMLRALPARPAEMSGSDRQLLAALRTAHAAHEDVAETIARALAALAAELGSAAAVFANGPGSWEGRWVRGLLAGTAGDDGSGLPFYGAPGGSL